MCAWYRKRPVLAMEDLGLELGALRGDPIEELVRFGARLVLTSYLEAEVSAFLGAAPYERTPRRTACTSPRTPRSTDCRPRTRST